jgi:hypothetical protein
MYVLRYGLDIQYPTQWYHSRANLIWPNGPLKYIFPKIQ